MEEYTNKVLEADCLDILPFFNNQSIDMILCDLPYGITQNKWDTIIALDTLWEQYKRIIKPAGVIALTGQGGFTGKLISSNLEWFRYKIVWIKAHATNFLNANKQPLRRHEDICIFYANQPDFNPQKIQSLPYDRGIRKDNKNGNYGAYKNARIINADGKRFPSDVLFFEEGEEIKDWVYFKSRMGDSGYHPTQKPIALGRWLIRSYSKPDDIILDNCCGSGTFLVAAVLEHRRFIGIEKNHQSYHLNHKPVDFIKICNQRINAAIIERDSQLFK